MASRLICVAVSLVCLNCAWAADKKPAAPQEGVFDMQEFSVFDARSPDSREHLTIGAYATCSTEPDKDVKAYPKLKSKRPLYGAFEFHFDPPRNGQSGTMLRFVLDESGEAPPDEAGTSKNGKEEKKPAEKADAKKPTAAYRTSSPNRLQDAKRSRYDRLYIDLNHDGDLTNDPVLRPMKSPPWDALPTWWGCKEKMAFEYLDLPVDYGPGIGVRPFRVLPWLTLEGDQDHPQATMHFVAATARKGRVRIGSHDYNALLWMYGSHGRWDCPWISLRLTPVIAKDAISYEGFAGNSLGSSHPVDGKLFLTRATPLGDKLIVEPYRGDYGVFSLGPGNRKLENFSIRGGSLYSEKMDFSLSLSLLNQLFPAREFRVPVGDYTVQYAGFRYGKVSFSVSDNYHAEGRARDPKRRRTFGIAIRKDKPFVLDFSAKPEVMFTDPAKDKTFKPGDEVLVKAVLIDPALDLMIRRLTDMSQTEKKTYRLPDGKEKSYDQPVPLNPTVVVTDASGKKIAEGAMPFG
jgi:hypothetical protein